MPNAILHIYFIILDRICLNGLVCDTRTRVFSLVSLKLQQHIILGFIDSKAAVLCLQCLALAAKDDL